MTTPHDLRLQGEIAQAARRFRFVGIVLPIVVAAASALAQLAMLPALPRQIAIHWNAAGENSFGPAWTMCVLTLAIGLAMPLIVGGVVLSAIRKATAPVQARFLAAMTMFTVVLVSVLALGTMLIQLDLPDPTVVPSVIPTLIAAGVAGALAGYAVWRATIEPPCAPSETSEPDPIRIQDGETVVWLRDVRMAGSGRIGVIAAVALLALTSALLIGIDLATGGRLSVLSWLMLGLTVFLGALLLAFTRFHVRVDASGLTARSALGWPGTHVAAADIAKTEVVTVNPLAEFGGWGWRLAPGSGTGIVMRAGEALRVTRRDGRLLTITVDDAQTAAGLLRTIAS